MRTNGVSRRDLGAILAGGAVVSALARARPSFAAAASDDGLPRARPEDLGLEPGVVEAFLDDVARAGLELHSLMLSRKGQVIAEGWWWPYAAPRPHMMHSLTKSVTACGVGLALAERRFALTDRVVSFFPEHLPATVSDNLAAMTVHDLLTMRTGQAVETSGAEWRPLKTSWVKEFFKIPVPYRPGEKFVYTSAASYMLSAIITKTTGQTLADYLEPRVFAPLGINDVHWDVGPETINPGGNGLSWRTADILKLGMLHAQGGRWGGRQVLPADWVAAATRREAGNTDYGYQWWMGPEDAYYALGLFCQIGIVFPRHDAVLAFTGAIDGSSHILPYVWKHFPSAFAAGPVGRNDAGWTHLERRLEGLRLLPALRPTASPWAARVSGRLLPVEQPNEDEVAAIGFRFDRGRCIFTQVDARGTHTVEAGLGSWVEGATTITGAKLHHEYEPDSMPVVAGAEWTAPDTLKMTWQFVESAFRDTVVCRFGPGGVTLDRSVNVNSADLSRPTLHARLADRS